MMDRSLLVRLSTAGLIGTLATCLVAAGALAMAPRAAGQARQISTIGRVGGTISRVPESASAKSAGRSGARSPHGPFARGLAAGGGTISSPVLLLYINNIYAATLLGVDGCTSYADAVDQGGGDHTLGPSLELDPCVIRHTTAVQSNFEKFLDANLGGSTWGKEAEIVLADGYLKTIVAEVDVASPVITRFVVPGGDASSPSSVSFFTTITGTAISPVRESALVFPSSQNRTRPPLLSNFVFSLDGLKEPGVKETSSFVFKRTFDEKPGPWQLSDYHVTTGYTKSGDFSSWYSKSVLGGPSEKERSAQLQFLKLDLSAPLFTLNLPIVGLFRADGGFDTSGRDWTMYVDSANVTMP